MSHKKDLKEQETFEKAIFSLEDQKLYDLLFEELSKEDDIIVKPDFAPAITAKLVSKRRRENIKENFLFAGAILMIIAVTFAGFQFAKSIFGSEKVFLSGRIIAPVLALIGLITVFQVLDRMYIRNRKFRKLKQFQS